MTVKELVQGYLGKGVDAFQITYRGSESAFSPPDRNRVINVTPDMIDESVFDTTSIEQTYGSSFAEFIHKFSLEVGLKGSYGPFSASVSSQFDTSNTRISSAQFRRLSNTINGSMQSIGDDVAALKGHLTEDFKKALAKADPMYLLETFGTHVVVKEIIGGAAEYICHSAESTTISESDFKAAAEAKYQSVGGSIAGSTNVNTSDKETLKKVEGSLSLTVYGGNPKTQQSLRRNEQGGWENWAATVADNPVLLGYPRGGDGLLPIWKFVEDGEFAQSIRDAYKQMAAKNFTVQIVSATCPPSTRPDAQVMVPDNYKLLSGGAIVNDAGSNHGVLLTASFPESENIWRALGKDHMDADTKSITVFALALYDPDDIWEVRIFDNEGSEGPPTAHPSATVASNGDFKLVGGGAQVNWTGNGNLLTASYPQDANTWAANSKDHVTPDPATITVYALGLRSKIVGVQIEAKTQPSESQKESHPHAEVDRASGFNLVGGGAQVNWMGFGNLLTASYPQDANTWAANSKDHRVSDPATITAYAVGIKVITS